MKHVWELDARGEIEYFEQGEFHGGPHCTVCDEFFCEHERDFHWDADCPGPDDIPSSPATNSHAR